MSKNPQNRWSSTNSMQPIEGHGKVYPTGSTLKVDKKNNWSRVQTHFCWRMVKNTQKSNKTTSSGEQRWRFQDGDAATIDFSCKMQNLMLRSRIHLVLFWGFIHCWVSSLFCLKSFLCFGNGVILGFPSHSFPPIPRPLKIIIKKTSDLTSRKKLTRTNNIVDMNG